MNTIVLVILAPALAAAVGWTLRRGSAGFALAGAVTSLATASFGAALAPALPFSLRTLAVGDLSLQLRLTLQSAGLIVVVALIATVVFTYALRYQRDANRAVWFWNALSLFLAAMQLLVLAGDWITFIVGWEVMGFASFLLIATHFEEPAARRGAFRAFLLTRVTDLGLYVGVCSVYVETGSLTIDPPPEVTLAGLGAAGLILAAMGKSAQVPFQAWLAGAMAGPTPVSALLHSATLVAAGALLLLQAYPLLPDSALLIAGLVGGLTTVLAGLTALAARDLKHVLAASTSSQLGLMFLAIAAGSPAAALAHWVAHAFMKSGLFLTAGVLQEGYGSTSLASLRGAGRRQCFNYACLLVLGLALAGLPPLVGYYSKEGILGAVFESRFAAIYLPSAGLGVLASAAYVARVLRLLAGKDRRSGPAARLRLMQAATAVITVVVIFGGPGLKSWVDSAASPLPAHAAMKLAGLALLAVGLGAGWFIRRAVVPQRWIEWARDHFRLGGGFASLAGRPVLALARTAAVGDDAGLRAVDGVGKSLIQLARGSRALDRAVGGMVGRVGHGSLQLARLARTRTEAGLADLHRIAASSCHRAGRTARRWQSGLLHRELLLSAGVTLAGLVLVLLLAFTP